MPKHKRVRYVLLLLAAGILVPALCSAGATEPPYPPGIAVKVNTRFRLVRSGFPGAGARTAVYRAKVIADGQPFTVDRYDSPQRGTEHVSISFASEVRRRFSRPGSPGHRFGVVESRTNDDGLYDTFHELPVERRWGRANVRLSYDKGRHVYVPLKQLRRSAAMG